MTSRMIDDVAATRFVLLASIAAVTSGVFAITTSLFGTHIFNPLGVMDGVVLFGLAFGVYRKKSLAYAIILLVYHILARFYMYQLTGSHYAAFGPIPLSIAWVYFLGILGSLALHTKKKEASGIPVSSRLQPTS